MSIKRISRINVYLALVYFVIILLTTLIARFLGVLNTNNILLRITFSFLFSVIMIFVNIDNYSKMKNVSDITIKNKATRITIIIYYAVIFGAALFYVYESLSPERANGAYTMAGAAMMLATVVNRSIQKECELVVENTH